MAIPLFFRPGINEMEVSGGGMFEGWGSGFDKLARDNIRCFLHVVSVRE